MALIYFTGSIVISLVLIRRLFVLLTKTEEDTEKAKRGLEMLIWPILLAAFVAFTLEQIPKISQSIDKSTDSTNVSVDQSVIDEIDIPNININIGEMRLETNDVFMVPYTFDKPEDYDIQLLWKSSNEKCVTINESGQINAKAIGQALISVSPKEYPDNILKTFRVFVFGSDYYKSEYSPLELKYSSVSQQSNDNGKYLVFFDIIRNEPVDLATVQITLFTEDGEITYTETYIDNPASSAKSNCAGTFSLDYHDTYFVICTARDQNGKEYMSEPYILRPWEEIGK